MDFLKLHKHMTFHSISMKCSKVTIGVFHNPLTQSHLIETYTSKANVHSLVIRLSSLVIPLLLSPIAKFIISTTHNNSQFYLNQGIRLLCKILFSFPRIRREIRRRNISSMLKTLRGGWMILHSVVVACIHIDCDTVTGLHFQDSKGRRIFMYNDEWYCLLHKSPFRRKGFIFIIHKDTLKIDRLSSPLSHYLINLDNVL